MRVGLITITDFNNYGNRLQNYALQEVIKNMGHSPVSYATYVPKVYKKGIKYLLFGKNEETIKERILDICKLRRFTYFDKKYVRTKAVGRAVFPSSLNDECDIFIAGSDQIWNPNWYTEYSFLQFAEGKKKVAYAASFGCDDIPEKLKALFEKWLRQFENISVRELTGVKIVKELTGSNPVLVLDPTILLKANDWIQVEKRPLKEVPNGAYILNYFLGGMTIEQEKYINNLSRLYNLKMLNLLDRKMPEVFIAGPCEFVYLIHHAAMVCTDSFHASVFSILFHVPFIVFDRNGKGKEMGNRIDTLLNMTSLNKRKNVFCLESDIFDVKFETADLEIDKKKRESLGYLEMVLKQND